MSSSSQIHSRFRLSTRRVSRSSPRRLPLVLRAICHVALLAGLAGYGLACSRSSDPTEAFHITRKPPGPLLAVPEGGTRDVVLPMLDGPFSRAWTEKKIEGGPVSCRSFDLDRDGSQDVIFGWRDGRLILRQWLNDKQTCEKFHYDKNGVLAWKELWTGAEDRTPLIIPCCPLDPSMQIPEPKEDPYAWTERWGKTGKVIIQVRKKPGGTGHYVADRTFRLRRSRRRLSSCRQFFAPGATVPATRTTIIPCPAFARGPSEAYYQHRFEVTEDLGASQRSPILKGNNIRFRISVGHAGLFHDQMIRELNGDANPESIYEMRSQMGSQNHADPSILTDANSNGCFEIAHYFIFSREALVSVDDYSHEVRARSTNDDGVYDSWLYRAKGETDWTRGGAKEAEATSPTEVNYLGQPHFPRVVQLDPPNGAAGVDPARHHITVVFDRPMQSGYSWVDRGNRPKLDHIEWIDDRHCRAWVTLEPNREYGLWLNFGPRTSKFRSWAGVAADRVYWEFQTGGWRDGGPPKTHHIWRATTPVLVTEATGNLLASMVAVNRCQVLRTSDGLVLSNPHLPEFRPHIRTRERFRPPFVLKVHAQTDSTNIRIRYGDKGTGCLIFNWEGNPKELRMRDPLGRQIGHPGTGWVEPNEWHDFVWEWRPDGTRVIVDGEERYRQEGRYSDVAGPLGIGPALGSAVTVQSFIVEPLPYPMPPGPAPDPSHPQDDSSAPGGATIQIDRLRRFSDGNPTATACRFR